MSIATMIQTAKQGLEYLAQLEAERKEREAEARAERWERNGWGKPAESDEE